VTVGKRTATAAGAGATGVGVGRMVGDGVPGGFKMAQIQSSCRWEPIKVRTAASRSVVNPNAATRSANRPFDRRDAVTGLVTGVAAISTNRGHLTYPGPRQ